jgi:hypothetical protein
VIFHCCDTRRLEVLRRSGSKNAVEFLEVLDHAAPPAVPRQQTLFVRLLRSEFTLTPDNLRIRGGSRIPVVGIEWAAPGDALPPQAEPGLVDGVEQLDRTLVVRTMSSGDFSRYTFSIVAGSGSETPPADFDPLLSAIEFSFKVECPSDFDCDAPQPCPPVPLETPQIDYLAKDYQGFRRLLLDRLSLLAPGWSERSAADLGVTLVELLAFAADTLSYRQDAIANEAYLNTARQRISVRRHARLVDYYLHEGCNARAFVHFEMTEGAGEQLLPRRTPLLTRVAGLPTVMEPGSRDERRALHEGALIFETAHAVTLRAALNRLSFYTWGDLGCSLGRGATRATLRGYAHGLQAGDFLVFAELVSPKTFEPKDADPTHRHVVRLTRVLLDEDPSGRLFEEPPVDEPAPITRIEWDAADALPFPLCISVAARPDLEVSAALGNVAMVDHGVTHRDEELPPVPPDREPFATVSHTVGDCCKPKATVRPPLRYRPLLTHAPLTHGFDLDVLLALTPGGDEEWWSAAAFRALDARQAGPRIALVGKLDGEESDWTPLRDLLNSASNIRDFTVEVRDDGRAQLRFGDGSNGQRPEEGTIFSATYRTGNGTAGNVGAEAIAHLLITPALAISAISNPMPAFGGTDAEEVEAARRDAPQAFRTQERAVTESDYAAVAERRADVQRAAATVRWTGSWHTVFVTADRVGGGSVDTGFEARLRRHLERFRMAGYDLEVDSPRLVALDVALHLCVKTGYLRSDILRTARDIFSNRLLPDGRLGAFHPDNFTFGQPVYLSRLVADAQSIEGVDSVRVDRFQRLADPSPVPLETGVISIGRLEIAQLDNDPSFPERGSLTLTLGGGR